MLFTPDLDRSAQIAGLRVPPTPAPALQRHPPNVLEPHPRTDRPHHTIRPQDRGSHHPLTRFDVNFTGGGVLLEENFTGRGSEGFCERATHRISYFVSRLLLLSCLLKDTKGPHLRSTESGVQLRMTTLEKD